MSRKTCMNCMNTSKVHNFNRDDIHQLLICLVLAFSHAIDWSETWIKFLIAFHSLLFVLFIMTRKNITMQTVLFFTIVSLVFLAEPLNSVCAANWRLFSKQNYFDEHGVFASTMFAGPLLLIGFCQLVCNNRTNDR